MSFLIHLALAYSSDIDGWSSLAVYVFFRVKYVCKILLHYNSAYGLAWSSLVC